MDDLKSKSHELSPPPPPPPLLQARMLSPQRWYMCMLSRQVPFVGGACVGGADVGGACMGGVCVGGYGDVTTLRVHQTRATAHTTAMRTSIKVLHKQCVEVADVGGVLLTQVHIAEMQPLLLVSSAGKGKHQTQQCRDCIQCNNLHVHKPKTTIFPNTKYIIIPHDSVCKTTSKLSVFMKSQRITSHWCTC